MNNVKVIRRLTEIITENTVTNNNFLLDAYHQAILNLAQEMPDSVVNEAVSHLQVGYDAIPTSRIKEIIIKFISHPEIDVTEEGISIYGSINCVVRDNAWTCLVDEFATWGSWDEFTDLIEKEQQLCLFIYKCVQELSKSYKCIDDGDGMMIRVVNSHTRWVRKTLYYCFPEDCLYDYNVVQSEGYCVVRIYNKNEISL